MAHSQALLRVRPYLDLEVLPTPEISSNLRAPPQEETLLLQLPGIGAVTSSQYLQSLRTASYWSLKTTKRQLAAEPAMTLALQEMKSLCSFHVSLLFYLAQSSEGVS